MGAAAAKGIGENTSVFFFPPFFVAPFFFFLSLFRIVRRVKRNCLFFPPPRPPFCARESKDSKKMIYTWKRDVVSQKQDGSDGH